MSGTSVNIINTSASSNSVWATNSYSTLPSNVHVLNNSSNTTVLRTIVEHNDPLSLLRNGIRIDDDRIVSLTKDNELIVTQCHTDYSSSRIPIDVHHSGVVKLAKGNHHFLPGMVFKTPDGTVLKIDEHGGFTKEVMRKARKKVINVKDGNSTLYESLAFCHFRDIHIPSGHHSSAVFTLPNGVRIKLHPDDSIEIDESDGKQLYKAASIREFNKYLNASDLLEEFVLFCSKEKMTRKDFSELPISLFIYWLIVKAAEADGDPVDEVKPLLETTVNTIKHKRHRCKCCGKFLSRKFENHQIAFCSPEHMASYLSGI